MMLTIRGITQEDRETYLGMSRTFYNSDATAHTVPESFHRDSFEEAVARPQSLRIYMLEDEGGPVGYGSLVMFYSKEFGGRFAFIDEIYLEPRARGKGYGTRYLDWLFEQYKGKLKGFRLEVSEKNPRAMDLYKRYGFSMLDYAQMFKLIDEN